MIRALVADDQAVVRTGFVNLLATQEDIEVVAEAEDGVRAVLAARETRPDLALLDIRMPHKNGIDAAREILAASGGATKVLMLTTFGLDEYVYDALAAGAGASCSRTPRSPNCCTPYGWWRAATPFCRRRSPSG